MRRVASDRDNSTRGSVVVVMGFSFPFGLLAQHGESCRSPRLKIYPRVVLSRDVGCTLDLGSCTPAHRSAQRWGCLVRIAGRADDRRTVVGAIGPTRRSCD